MDPSPRERAAWMGALAEHLARMRRAAPLGEMCIAFDIDGTILDMRHLVAHVLLAYDRAHGTEHFRGLVPTDIAHHEDDVPSILRSLGIDPRALDDIARFYRSRLWDRDAVLAGSRPFEGVLGVIRWLQLQPRTRVALNTGRPEGLRALTLASLAGVGAAYRVAFDDDLLFMTAEGSSVHEAKVEAIERLRARGLRVVAVVDNEPENLEAIAAADPAREILLLHADTISATRQRRRVSVVSGDAYELGPLVPPRTFPQRVQFVWHGANDSTNLDRFLASDVRWAEVDVRRDPLERLVLRHDGFDETPWRRDEPVLAAADAIGAIAAAGRSIKVDLKEGGSVADEAAALVRSAGFGVDRVWFNSEIQTAGREGFERLRDRFPGCTISCPVDPLVPMFLASESAMGELSRMLRTWGVSRLSVRWGPVARSLLDRLESSGWEVNLYDVADLEGFLHASLMFPTSVTADFNFPGRGYLGRGSGAGGRHHRYPEDLTGSAIPA